MQEILDYLMQSNQIHFFIIAIPRLAVAAILSGLVGMEREHMNRPAGARTHVLVGVSAALIMVTSEYIFEHYRGVAVVDPTRLGAQVVSGIGFIGAGTIIKEGYSVKGLTTAAGLWSIACIGIASGCGFYSGAIFATFIIYITLQVYRKILEKYSHNKVIKISFLDADLALGVVKRELEQYEIQVNFIEVLVSNSIGEQIYKLHVYAPVGPNVLEDILTKVRNMDGVSGVTME